MMINTIHRYLKHITGAVLLFLIVSNQVHSQAPKDWGPVSIGLEEIEYPHPVSYMKFSSQGHDVRMAYMDIPPRGKANGQAVVLMHGLNFFGEYWAGTIDALTTAGFRVVVPDQIGFGRSSKPVIAYSFQEKAANTKMLLDKIGVENAAIVGHSMGGMLATRFAFTYPETATHLVLVNMIGQSDFRLIRPWQSTDDLYQSELNRSYEEIRKGQERYYVVWKPEYEKYIRIHYGWTLSPEMPRLAWVRALNRQMIYSQPVVYEFPHIQSRTLILSGRDDTPEFADQARQTAEAIPDAELILFENVGHNPHFESPDRFYQELIRFLTTM